MPQDKSFPGQSELTSPAETWAELDPDDDEDLPFAPKAVYVASTTGGQFVAVGDDDVEARFYGTPGQVLLIRPKRIKSTGLTVGLVLTGLRT